jgi:hypothetical protein
MTLIRWLLVTLFAVLCAIASPQVALSQPLTAVRVDDSGTVVSTPLVPMQWRNPVPGRGASNDVDGEVDVALRLNLAPWLHRDVRLYMVLDPLSIPGTTLTARWRTGGRLLPGTVQSGGRALVFQGRITEASFQERMHFTLTTDGGRLSATQALQFHIEAEAR